ncbi:iron complex transport system substrate-binding protein [Methanophagales archaeon]|nr:iron complex transport system substrate-binding protein [Methanophagales archaeon]
MRNVLSYILVMGLIGSTMLLTVMPAIAIGIPGDDDGNDNLTEKELASNILNYMLGEGDLSLYELRDAAHVYAHWNGMPRTIVDTAERTVTIYKPVKTIVALSSDSARALRILGDEDKVVGISETIKKHPYYFPEMSHRKSVGTWKEVDWEEIVALEPDLLITYATGSINADLAADKLDPFGITVVGLYLYVTDEYEQIFDEHEKLAILLEKEEAADKYLKWHDGYETRVHDFIAGKEKPKVFMTYTGGSIGKIMEIASYGPDAIDYTLCDKAGGSPITEVFSTKYPKVSAEWVLRENPDIIILKGGGVFGGWDNETEPANLIAQTLVGKNWGDINAIENNKIYAVPWSITNGLEHIYGEVLLAKICHPELDIDPTEVYKEFLEDFLRVEYPEGKVLVYPSLAS